MDCWLKPETVGEEDTRPTELSWGGREGRGAADTLVALSPRGQSLRGCGGQKAEPTPPHTPQLC